MATTAYRVEGAAQLRRALRQAGGNELLNDLKAEHQHLARTVTSEAVRLAPVVSGALAMSMRGSGTRTMATVRAGRASLPYAGPVHWGTPDSRRVRPMHVRANPWMAIAAQRTEPEWSAHYEQALRRLMERASSGG